MDVKVKEALKSLRDKTQVLYDEDADVGVSSYEKELNIIEQALNEQDKKLKEYQEGNKTLGENLRLQNIEIGELKGANNALSQDLEKAKKFAKLFTRDRLHDGCRINNYDTNSVDWGLLFRLTEAERDFYNKEADKYGKKEG